MDAILSISLREKSVFPFILDDSVARLIPISSAKVPMLYPSRYQETVEAACVLCVHVPVFHGMPPFISLRLRFP